MRQDDAEKQLSAHHQRKIKFTTFREMKYNLPLNKWNHNICNIQKKMSTKMMMMAIRKMQKEGEQNWIRPIVNNNFLHVAYIPFLGGQRRSGQRKKQQQKLWDSIFLDWICAQVAADDAMILLFKSEFPPPCPLLLSGLHGIPLTIRNVPCRISLPLLSIRP